ncbi:MAG: hypothetical protein AVDCRST_MAG10-184, partial [uncultured Acidimicrobiales bacterium]
ACGAPGRPALGAAPLHPVRLHAQPSGLLRGQRERDPPRARRRGPARPPVGADAGQVHRRGALPAHHRRRERDRRPLRPPGGRGLLARQRAARPGGGGRPVPVVGGALRQAPPGQGPGPGPAQATGRGQALPPLPRARRLPPPGVGLRGHGGHGELPHQLGPGPGGRRGQRHRRPPAPRPGRRQAHPGRSPGRAGPAGLRGEGLRRRPLARRLGVRPLGLDLRDARPPPPGQPPQGQRRPPEPGEPDHL